jgi:excinuclease ABC subunit C
VGFDASEEETALLSSLLTEMNEKGRKISVSVPQKGDNKKLCVMADENARQAALKYRRDSEKGDSATVRLAQLLSLEVVPDRIESYDISNLGDEHITAGMIVLEGGKFIKSDYRTFKITTTDGADDYGSLREALRRRFAHLSDADGAFAKAPDLILLDGGAAQLSVALEVADEMGINIPFAGMVKDDYHKTRALVTRDGEVNIAREREVYVFLYKIQEEVHRFTVSRMSAAKRKTIKHSSLEKIHGIGAVKAKKLLAAFGSLAALKSATVEQIAAVKGISATDAESVVQYFKETNGR